MVSNLGGMVQTVAAAWLMTTLTNSTLMVALVQAASSLPNMLLALWAGAIADNFNRRKVMLASQVFMLAVSVLLVVMALTDTLSPALLLISTFLLGCGYALNWPSMQVAIADFVPRGAMPKAVALNAMGVNIARSIGPAIGGAIIAGFGAAMAFLANALSYLGLIGVLSRWRYQPPKHHLPRERLGPAMLAGLRYVGMSPVIVVVVFRSACFGLVATSIPALMPIIARDLVGGGPLTFGFLLGAFGLGAVSGALGSGRIRSRFTAEGIVRFACILTAAGAAIAAASSSLFLTLPAMALAGAGWLTALSNFNVTIQLSAPRWVVARALSLYQTGTYGGLAVGSWAIGALADRYGSSQALYLAALGMLIVLAAGFRWPMRSFDNLDLAPRADWEIPETTVPIDLRSGPIVVTVEHRVHDRDAVEFVDVMQERSRILRRDGARRWNLLRDLMDQELWIERYHLPTWLDYVQLNKRRTQADLASMAQLDALRVPGTKLVVHRRIEHHGSFAAAFGGQDATELTEPAAAARPI